MCQSTHERLSRFAPQGAYLNFLGATNGDSERGGIVANPRTSIDGMLTAVFGIEKLELLRAVKLRYDPDDIYRPVVHISPESRGQMNNETTLEVAR
jgi:hypothetical protein